MTYSEVYLYSPLSVKTVQEGKNGALLIQFILSELLHAMDAGKKEAPLEFVFSSATCFFPYDWAYETGCLNKMKEHGTLLPHAFKNCDPLVEEFNDQLLKTLTYFKSYQKINKKLSLPELLDHLRSLYHCLGPFFLLCKESENLLLFLLRKQKEIEQLAYPENFQSLLLRMFPEGLEDISHLIHQEYQNRGFHSLLSEIDQFFAVL